MNALKNANLGLRFCLELAALAALAAWGWMAASALLLRPVLAVVAPGAAGVAWGLFVSPKAKIPAHWTVRAAVEAAVFVAAAASLFAIGRSGLAGGFVALAVVSRTT
ncbi:MAG: YrdB family protein, partial [bacterium]